MIPAVPPYAGLSASPNGHDPFAAPRDPLKGATPEGARVTFRDVPVGVVPTWRVCDTRAALTEHQMGVFTRSSLLVESVLADDRVHATLGAVSSALFSRPVKFVRARGKGVDAGAARECLAAWKEVWPRLSQSGAFDTLIRWRKLMGFAPAEVLWQTDTPLWEPHLKFFHPMYVLYRLDLRRYVAITLDGERVIEPGSGKWFLHAPYGEYRGWQLGAIRAIAPLWLARTYALRDWSRYSEVHGIPIVKAKVPAGGDAQEKQRFTTQVSTLGQESVVMLPQGVDLNQNYDLELLEAKDRSWEAFRGLIDQCDMSITLALLHQNLMTEMKEGSFAAARQHADVRQEEIAFSEKTFMHDLYMQVARPFALFNFGDANLAPRTRFDIDPDEDHAMRSEILLRLSTAVDLLARNGHRTDVAALAKQFGLSLSVEEAAIAKLVLAPTDVAKVTLVDEARTSQGLGEIGDERGKLTIAQLDAATKAAAAPPAPSTPEEDDEGEATVSPQR
jgi:hypothetical protein